jgi:hypothetical protein
VNQAVETYATLVRHLEAFDDLPAEALLKQDLLRLGLAFEDQAMSLKAYKPKDYFIFSFDLVELSALTREENLRAPEEIRLAGGPWQLRPTVVSVRLNPASPYRVALAGQGLELRCGDALLAQVEYHPRPPFYDTVLSSGKAMGEIAPVLEWGYLIYLTAYRMCQYFNRDEQCRFCDINRNFTQQRKAGRPYTGIKQPEEIVEALRHIAAEDDQAKAYTLTGGSIVTDLQGCTEVDFYLRYVEAIEAAFPGRWIAKAVVQAFEPQDCGRLKSAGIRIYHPNYEVWGEQLFNQLCPGKARTVGFANWIRRVADAAEIFGAECVIPNFVGGVEMNRQCGFAEPERAVAHTSEGLDWFMSRGIVPRFTTWCPEPLAALGPQPAPPLTYFAMLLRTWRERFHHYHLAVPPGYGPAGPGKAVFSVSAFMDILDAETLRSAP